MKELTAPPTAFDVTVLEVATSTDTLEQICDRAVTWKEKLGTRASVGFCLKSARFTLASACTDGARSPRPWKGFIATNRNERAKSPDSVPDWYSCDTALVAQLVPFDTFMQGFFGIDAAGSTANCGHPLLHPSATWHVRLRRARGWGRVPAKPTPANGRAPVHYRFASNGGVVFGRRIASAPGRNRRC